MDDPDITAICGELVERERQLLQPGESVDVGALLAVDFVEVGASGRLWSRTEALELVVSRRGGGIGPYDLLEVGCRALGGHTYLLTYAIRTGRGLTRRVSVWRVVEERWQLTYHQGTRVPA